MGDGSPVTVKTMSSVWLTLAFLMPHPTAGRKADANPVALPGSIPAAAAHAQGQPLTGHP